MRKHLNRFSLPFELDQPARDHRAVPTHATPIMIIVLPNPGR
jgi:hypothetical protein